MLQKVNSPDKFVSNADKRRFERWNVIDRSLATHFTTTKDGWEIAVTQYSEAKGREYPVLLCHGLGSSRWSFDIDTNNSLAQHLVKQGYAVFAIDLRGTGRSEKPGTSDKKYGWGFNEYCEQDLPAAYDLILELTGKSQLHHIGHSMGGILLLCRAALQDKRIKSAITIGSSLDYSNSASIFHKTLKFLPLAGLARYVPINWSSSLSSLGTKFTKKMVDPVLAFPYNVDTYTYRKFASVAMNAVSTPVLVDLANAITGKGLCSSAGVNYSEALKEHGYPMPVLAVAGSKDAQCPPEVGTRYGTDHKIFGKTHGHNNHYGHSDLIMGQEAHLETWPVYSEWLAYHDKN